VSILHNNRAFRMEFKEKLSTYVAEIEQAFETLLPPESARPVRIHQAMRYSLFAEGKRIRPALVLAACERFDNPRNALPAAVAVECLHTYTLIHDDLPAVDDSPLRRGRPTCHIQFDEATAILAGDALLTYAFQLLSRHYAGSSDKGIELIQVLSEASSSEHLIGGQMEDILGEQRVLEQDELNFIHINKTSALIEASLEMGAIIGGATPEQTSSIISYGRCIGLGFQIVDDILDATSDTQTLGKSVGADEASNKSTYVALHGLEKSRQYATELATKAYQICDGLDMPFLKDLAIYLNRRTN